MSDWTLTHIQDDIYAVNGPGLEQPMFVTGEEHAERAAERLRSGQRKPAQGEATFEATLEIT